MTFANSWGMLKLYRNVVVATQKRAVEEWITRQLTNMFPDNPPVVHAVLTREMIIPKVHETNADLLIIDDNLPSEFDSAKEKDKEWLDIIEELRLRLPVLRIAFIGNRKLGDAFLGKLIESGVLDLFLGTALEPNEFREVLQKPPEYARVAKYRAAAYGKDFGWVPKGVPEKEKEIQQLERLVYVEKPVEVEKIVEIPVPQVIHIQPKLVVFGSISSGAGATFLATNFAAYLDSLHVPVAVLEGCLRKPTLYHLLWGEKNAPKGWVSWFEQLQYHNSIEKGTEWRGGRNGNIFWVPVGDRVDAGLWEYMLSLKLLTYVRQVPIVLVDLSTEWDTELARNVLAVADEVWVVADFDPLHYLQADGLLRKLLEAKVTPKLIANRRYSERAERRFVGTFGEEPITWMPDFGSSVLEAMWEGKLYFDCDQDMEKYLRPLAERILDKALIRNRKGNFRIKQSLFSRVRGKVPF